jgi:hypothetical protein
MEKTTVPGKNLAEATAKFVDFLHHKYSGIKIQAIPSYEDEDFTVKVTIPKALPVDQVEETCHKECIKVEDEYGLFILPKVVHEI